jgi:hypothetical protein
MLRSTLLLFLSEKPAIKGFVHRGIQNPWYCRLSGTLGSREFEYPLRKNKSV